MARILIAYSTVDGYTRKICERIRQSLERDGHAAELAELGGGAAIDVAPYAKIVIGASIRYGKHRPHVYEFVEAHRRALEQKPSAFFTVNVVARKPGKDTPEGNPYMKKFRRKARWTPAEQAVFAGRIDYSLYGTLDRLIIRFIMWLTKGPTDPGTKVEFTDWAAVDKFARRVSIM
jgi:menaquinone-dependent protoporphyrinogen oxidase